MLKNITFINRESNISKCLNYFKRENFCKDKMHQNLEKIIKEEEEESTQDKYKDFMTEIKKNEFHKRKFDNERYNFFKKFDIPFYDIKKILLQRNFLKLRKIDSEIKANLVDHINNLENSLSLKKIEEIKFSDNITLYEIDYQTSEIYKKITFYMKLYFSLSLIVNLGFYFSFNLLFLKTNLIYLLCYFSNTLSFFTLLLNKRIKNKVLSIEYLPIYKSLKIRKWKLFSSKVVEKVYLIKDLEMTNSINGRFLEEGVILKNKNNSKDIIWVGLTNESIWHNKFIFEELFGKI